MSVTTLVGIESCPRRWALEAASYPDLWDGRGYPPRLHLGAAVGTVVHLALKTVTRALVSARCPSIHDRAAFEVMKSLGGYTSMINAAIDQVLDRFAGNPRTLRSVEVAAQALHARVPELRTRTQIMLSRLHVAQTSIAWSHGGHTGKRRPLTTGAFSEVELRATRMRWKGRADLLILSPEVCQITDIKTGARHETHELQIRAYALLWSRDAEINPTRRLADRLVLAYEDSNMEVAAPCDAELDVLEESMIARGEEARTAAYQSPPEARPGISACPFCDVRHLCPEYWDPQTQGNMVVATESARCGDAEVTVVGRHGPSSWDVRVEVSGSLRPGKPGVVRTDGSADFEAGTRLRVLDAHIAAHGGGQEHPVVITLGALSEVYAVTMS